MQLILHSPHVPRAIVPTVLLTCDVSLLHRAAYFRADCAWPSEDEIRKDDSLCSVTYYFLWAFGFCILCCSCEAVSQIGSL